MNKAKIFSVAALIGCVACMGNAWAWVVGPGHTIPGNPTPVEQFNPQTGEMRNQVVLYQRIDQRQLNTEKGIVNVPYSAEIVDSRPVEDWYLKKNAKVTFVFIKDKMIRVEISQ